MPGRSEATAILVQLSATRSRWNDRRIDELALKLIDGIPVIRAWGVSPHLDPLIDRCIAKLTGANSVRGLVKEGTTNKFLHPLPSLQSQQVLWVNRMVDQCQELTLPAVESREAHHA